MATISFKDFELNQTCITGKRKPEVLVDSIRMRYKIDPTTKERTDTPDGYSVDILTARGKLQTVKLANGAITDAIAEQISTALSNRKIVKVNFGSPASTLRGRCYAMFNSGQLIQGVSCTATELNIVSIDEPDDDELDDIEIEL